MVISFVGAASDVSAAQASTSSSTTLPSGILASDLIILGVGRNVDAALTTVPTGYNFLRTLTDAGTAPAAANLDLYWRPADGTETTTGPTVAASTAGATIYWLIASAVYRGVDITNPFIVENGQVQATSSTARAAPALTNTDANAWGVFMTLQRQVATPATFTPPTGMTERLDIDRAATGTTNPSGEWADSNGAVAAGAVTYSATASATSAIAVSWAGFLRPASLVPVTKEISPPVNRARFRASLW